MGFLSWLQGHCPAGASRWGWVAVQLGLFFLASSALLEGMLLVVGLVVATWRKGFAAYWSDGLNRVLLLLAGATQAVSGGLAWWGLFNWLPFFWGFWGWQAYVATPDARRRCSSWLVAVRPVALAACRSWCALRFPIPSGNVSRIRHLIVLWPPRA